MAQRSTHASIRCPAPQEWRVDITLFVLLLAAFSAANALSLVAITFVGLGMALPPRPQQVSSCMHGILPPGMPWNVCPAIGHRPIT